MQSKERRLKKYEGEARVVAFGAGDPTMEFLSPFGPIVARRGTVSWHQRTKVPGL